MDVLELISKLLKVLMIVMRYFTFRHVDIFIMLCTQNYIMQLTDEDAVVAKAFHLLSFPTSLIKVRQACLIEDIAFSNKLKLNDLLMVFGRSLVNKRVKLGRHLTREDIQLQ